MVIFKTIFMSLLNQKSKKKKNHKAPKRKKLLFLDLGCGENKISPEGLYQNALIEEGTPVEILGVDFHKVKGVDKIHDLTKFPYPFKKESIDGIFSSHFIEHLDGPERIKFFDEMYRILKPGAKMRLIHPYYKSSRAIQDPTHKWPPICEESYQYWNKNWRTLNKLGHYLGNSNFEIVNMTYSFMDSTWLQKSSETTTFAIRHYFNVVADMMVDLKKI